MQRIGLMQKGLTSSTLIGTSLSEHHTNNTALQDACVCMLVCGHIPKILIERTDMKYTYISNLHMC